MGSQSKYSSLEGWCSSKWCNKNKREEIQETLVKLEVCTKSSKSLVMASSILSAYAYVEFIPWYAWLSLSSLFWSLVWIFMLWRVAKLFYLPMIESWNILFRLCIFMWMNSYGRYFDIVLSVKYSRWMLATIVLLESPHGIYFDGLKARGAWYMHFDLLHGCDNMISRLANKAKVLA